MRVHFDGLSFAAKDVFDIAGQRTGFGNPTWLDTHPPAERTAYAVARLLGAGARLDRQDGSPTSFTYSLTGENVHYGTPRQPCLSRGVANRVLERIGLRRSRQGLRPCARNRAAPALSRLAGKLLRDPRDAAHARPVSPSTESVPSRLELRHRRLVCARGSTDAARRRRVAAVDARLRAQAAADLAQN